MVSQAMNPVPRKNSELLHTLNGAAIHILDQPRSALGWREPLEELREEIRAALKRPADGPRTIDLSTESYVNALINVGQHSQDTRWVVVARALRPFIVDDYRRAIECELDQMRSDPR